MEAENKVPEEVKVGDSQMVNEEVPAATASTAEQEAAADESMKVAQEIALKEEAEEAAALVAAQEGEEEAPKGTPITSYIKADIAKQLVEMGFSQAASEKALFMNLQNQNVELAMNWLGEHAEDPDLNEALMIVGQEGEGAIKKQYAGNLSKEERIKIAEEKIKAGRIRRAAEEK